MTPTTTLDHARRAISLGDRIERHEETIEELKRLHEAAAAAGRVELSLGFPFGGASVTLRGDRTPAALDAVIALADAERSALIAELQSLGYAYAARKTGPQPQAEA